MAHKVQAATGYTSAECHPKPEAGMDVPSSERLHLDVALRANEERYRSIFARNPMPMLIFEPNSLSILAVNEAALARYGYTRDEFLRLTLRELRPPQELGALWRARTAILAGQEVHGVFRHMSKQGEMFDVEVHSTPLMEGDRRLMLTTIVDISEHRRAADVAGYLDHASSLFTSTLDRGIICRTLASLAAARFGDWCAVHWLTDDGRIEVGGFAHGNPLDEPLVEQMVRGRNAGAPEHPVAIVLESARAVVLQPGDNGEVVRGETIVRDARLHRTAPPPWQLEARAAMYLPIRGTDRVRAVLECVATTRERAASAEDVALAEELAARASRALQNAQRFDEARWKRAVRDAGGTALLAGLDRPSAPADPLIAVVEHITDGFIMVDAEWRFAHANRMAERILRCSREELLGRDFWTVFPNLQGTPFQREYERAMATKRPVEFEAYYAEHDAWYGVSLQPSPRGLGIFFRNTTPLHRAEDERLASERFFFQHAELATELIHVVRQDGTIGYANRAWREALGYDLSTRRALEVSDLLAPASREVALRALERACAGEEVRDVEFEVIGADGRIIRVRGSGGPWTIPGQPAAAFGIMRVVPTEDQASMTAAAPGPDASVMRRWQRDLVDRLNLELRTPLTSILGFAELLERTPARPLAPGDRDFVQRIARQGRQLLATVEDLIAYAELDTQAPDPRGVALAAILDDVLGEASARAAACGVQITSESGKVMAPVRGDAMRVRQLLRYLVDHAIRATPHGRVHVALTHEETSPHAAVLRIRHSGADARGGLGITIARSLCAALGLELTQHQDALEGGCIEVRFGGRSIPGQAGAPGVPDADRELAALLHAVVNASPLAVVVHDSDWTIRLWSDAATRIFGWTAAEVVGERSPIVPEEEVSHLHQLLGEAIRTGGVTEAPVRRRHKDGRIIEAHCSIAPLRAADGRFIGFVTLLADVTATNELEAQLRHSQKMEIVGQLAGGIAHDFNNLLTVISANAWFLLEGLAPDDPRRQDVEEIDEASRRAAALTRQLLVFARKGVPERQVVDVRDSILGTERMLRRIIGSSIEVGTVTGDEPCLVMMDPGQLEQVLMNLAVNARDAMPEGGSLTIEARVSDARDAAAGVPAGQWIVMSVSDTGTGIPADVRARIFEPFFTTKEAGRGTGLGLAIVQTIVGDAGGRIVTESPPGKGTTFHVYLPAAGADAMVTRSAIVEHPARGTETVLVAEDQDALRRVVTRALGAAGYTVLTARHGVDALEIARTHVGPIDVLLTDIVMPDMNGFTLAERIRQERPDTRVVLMSGYSERLRTAPRDAVFVQKPFTTVELAAAVRRALTGMR